MFETWISIFYRPDALPRIIVTCYWLLYGTQGLRPWINKRRKLGNSSVAGKRFLLWTLQGFFAALFRIALLLSFVYAACTPWSASFRDWTLDTRLHTEPPALTDSLILFSLWVRLEIRDCALIKCKPEINRGSKEAKVSDRWWKNSRKVRTERMLVACKPRGRIQWNLCYPAIMLTLCP